MSPHREEPHRPIDHAHPDSRRTFVAKLAAAGLLTTALSETGCTAKSSSQLRLACQTNAWPSTTGLENLIPVLDTLKTLDFEGYETSFRNVQEAYSSPEPARAQLEKTGLTCAGVHVAGPDLYLPETGIPSLDFLRAIATGSAALGAEYLILSGRGAMRWQDDVGIGRPLIVNSDGAFAPDLANPFFGPSETTIDAWVGFERPITVGGTDVDWRVQLNVRNLLDEKDLIPVRADPDGGIPVVRIPVEQTWEISNTFRF